MAAAQSATHQLLVRSADALVEVVDDLESRVLDFVSNNAYLAEQARLAARLSFNLGAAVSAVKGPLAQLHTQGFEHDGVWEQLRIHDRQTIPALEKLLDSAETAQNEQDSESSDDDADSRQQDGDDDQGGHEDDGGENSEDDAEDEHVARIRQRAMAFEEDGDEDLEESDEEDDDSDDEADDDGQRNDADDVEQGQALDPELYTWTGQMRESALPVDEEGKRVEDGVFKWNDMDRFLEDMDEAQERGLAAEEVEEPAMPKQRQQTRKAAAEAVGDVENDEDEGESSDEEDPDVDFFSSNPTAALEAHQRALAGGSVVSAAAHVEGSMAGLDSISGYLEKLRSQSAGGARGEADRAALPSLPTGDLGRRLGESKEEALERIRAEAAQFDDFFGPRRRSSSSSSSSSSGGGGGGGLQGLHGSSMLADDEEDGDDDEEDDADDGGRKRVRFAAKLEAGRPEHEAADAARRVATAEAEEEAEAGEEAEEGAAASMSSHEVRQAALRRQIGELEQKAVEAYMHKPWLLRGEVGAAARPENSLLEAVVEHEAAMRPPPQLTATATASLEDLIRQRIADELFDDPERRDRPRADLGATEREAELSTEKAARGLGDEYEEAYRREAMGQKGQSKEAALEREVSVLWAGLSGRLDALAHMTYTPRMTEAEAEGGGDEEGGDEGGGKVKVRESAPALAMEDVQPTLGPAAAALAAAGAAHATPQEIRAVVRGRAGVEVGASELEPEDKQRRRRTAKAQRRRARKDKAAAQRVADRSNPGMGNKHERERLVKELMAGGNRAVTEGKEAGVTHGDFATSSKFFSRMQDEAKREAAKLSTASAAATPDSASAGQMSATSTTRLASVSKRSRKGKATRSRAGAAASVML